MKFSCNQKTLANCISLTQKATATHTTLSVLEGIHMETVQDVIRVKATDLDITIETYLEAEVIEEGSVIIPSKLFGDIVRKLPDAEVLITVQNNHEVRIECYNSIINIHAIPGDYPDIQQIEQNNPIEIKQDVFKEMIQHTIFAVAQTDQVRPELTGALLEIQDGVISMVCIDGFRLALAKEPLPEQRAEFFIPANKSNTIIPAKTLNEMNRILAQSQSSMDIVIGDRHILFDIGNARITSKLLTGKFMDYRQILHNNYKTRIKLDKKLLHKSIERASILAKDDKNNLIKMRIQEDKLVIESNSEIGDIHEEVPILLEGNEMEIAFNSRYFMEILRVIEDKEICIDFMDGENPCIVRPLENEKYSYMILPVRIY